MSAVNAPMLMLANDAVLHIFYFLPMIDLSRLGATCRSWRDLICSDNDQSRHLWQGVMEGHHLNKGEDADLDDYDLGNISINLIQLLCDCMDPSNVNTDLKIPLFERQLLVLLENKIFSARCHLRDKIARCIDERTRKHMAGHDSEATALLRKLMPSACLCLGNPKRTMATSLLKVNNKYFAPVYYPHYDWEANWNLVAELLRSDEVQKVLRNCVVSPFHNEDYKYHYCKPRNPNHTWPFSLCGYESILNGGLHTNNPDTIIKMMVPDDLERKLNECAAKWMEAEAKKLADKELKNLSQLALKLLHDNLWDMLDKSHRFWEDFQNCTPTLEDIISHLSHCIEHDFETSVPAWQVLFHGAFSIDKVAEDIVNDMPDMVFEKNMFAKFRRKNINSLHSFTDGNPLCSARLCAAYELRAFLPLNYKLAQLLSPPDAELEIYVSDGYAVVFDKKRNIVFDHFYLFYHHNKKPSASEASSISRGSPKVPAGDLDNLPGGLGYVDVNERKRQRVGKYDIR